MGERIASLLAQRRFGSIVLGACFLTGALQSQAAPGVARLTRVAKDVKVSPARAAAHSAAVNEAVPDGATVRTAADSQSELTFADRTLVRLAAKTTLQIASGSREMQLREGAMLVSAPASATNPEIHVADAFVAAKGTTCLLEHNAGKYVKLVVLEGTARMFLPKTIGESVLVKEGQLLMFHLGPNVTSLPNPVDVDIKHLVATSKLIQGFAPLRSESSIRQGVATQKSEKSGGALVDTNLVIFGRGTMVSLVDPALLDEEQKQGSTTPTATPSSKREPARGSRR
jgi:FecR-like protein